MGETTGISWTEKTWNPWQGCRKVSAGCKACYMFRDMERFGKDPTNVRRSTPATFAAPLKWKKPALVFTCSWSDWFIEEADAWRPEAWEIIRQTPHLTYQILTKRPERIADHLPSDWGNGWKNCWLGVSVEDQQRADERIPLLLQTPAAVRFLSVEPLLGRIRLDGLAWPPVAMTRQQPEEDWSAHMVHWVICGGESGPNFRPCDPAWIADLARQCQAAGVSVFVKQASGQRPGMQGGIPDEVWALKEFPP